ncbi:organic cation/carnitine transporter 3-like [Trifolium pratense]|uniref:organic cation/carnitine transporter 3-like n=1 Tax=Trifolium pratense TaxID=57577 RepID=UPI001E696EC7|nr:organic cation/carnitine transporter 3-like [Trifolium pratense]
MADIQEMADIEELDSFIPQPSVSQLNPKSQWWRTRGNNGGVGCCGAIPILTNSADSVEQEEKVFPSTDDMIEKGFGRFGWLEFVQCVLISFASFFDSQQSFITIYTDEYPTWHCTNSTLCNSGSNICNIPKSSWSWDGPSHKTVISQWNLECASSFVTGLPQSSFFIGCLLGSFLLSTLADTSLGRKNTIVMSCFSMSIFSILIVFATNIWIYSAFKFVIGFMSSSIGTCVLVLLAEKVSTEWRFTVGIFEYFCFTLGYMSLPGIAYFNRFNSWRLVYVCTSVPAICYSVLAYIFVTESPRWLLTQGRHQEAMAMLKGVSSLENGSNDLTVIEAPVNEQKASIFQLFSSMAELFGRRWALKRMVATMVLGVGIGMVYFGMPLAVGNLGFNIYLAVVFNALTEIPAYVATYFLENCRRKPSIRVFSIASGVCCIMCVVVGSGLQEIRVGLAMASFFSACTAFNVFLVYILELFPTSVRNTATSLVGQATVFGNVFTPFLISAGRKNDIFSYGVFGLVIMLSSFMLLGLPETRGLALCDTMDQQEKKDDMSLEDIENISL